MLTTECGKCGAAMPILASASYGWLSRVEMTITGYLCKECGHWNNFKLRKWYQDAKNKSETVDKNRQEQI